MGRGSGMLWSGRTGGRLDMNIQSAVSPPSVLLPSPFAGSSVHTGTSLPPSGRFVSVFPVIGQGRLLRTYLGMGQDRVE